MKSWTERPHEEAHLLNPAFCCAIITSASFGYREGTDLGMPLPLAFMVLPIVLHKTTRDTLPHNTKTSVAVWLQNHSSARVRFYERLMALKPYAREAITFGFAHKWLSWDGDGSLLPAMSDAFMNKIPGSFEDEAHACVLKGRFLGRWLGLRRLS